MRRIHYTQKIPLYDNETGEITDYEIRQLSVDSFNEHDFNEQLATVIGYCGDSYSVQTLPDTFSEQEKQRADLDYIAAMTGVNLDV